MTLEERIARLERDNRWWKRLTLLLALLPLGMLTLIGAGREETMDVLTVRELVIKDESGKVRSRIVAKKDGGIMQQFLAANGKERVRIGIEDCSGQIRG